MSERTPQGGQECSEENKNENPAVHALLCILPIWASLLPDDNFAERHGFIGARSRMLSNTRASPKVRIMENQEPGDDPGSAVFTGCGVLE
jgi:hypothetical protein